MRLSTGFGWPNSTNFTLVKMINQDPVRNKDSLRTLKQGPKEDPGPRILERGPGGYGCMSSEGSFLHLFVDFEHVREKLKI